MTEPMLAKGWEPYEHESFKPEGCWLCDEEGCDVCARRKANLLST